MTRTLLRGTSRSRCRPSRPGRRRPSPPDRRPRFVHPGRHPPGRGRRRHRRGDLLPLLGRGPQPRRRHVHEVAANTPTSAILQNNLDREQWLKKRLKRSIDLHNLRQQHLLENPDFGDLLRGDALNVVLQDLWDPRIHPSVLRYVSVPLPVAEVHTLSFQINQLGGAISRRTLTVDNGQGWPVELKVAALDTQRKAYLVAVDRLLELNQEGKLTLEAVRAVQKAVDDLKAGVGHTIPQTDRFYIRAQNFLRELGEQARLVEAPIVRQFLADLEKYPGTTVADLVELMRWYNLRFAPAEEGTPERKVFPHLYEALISQRDQVAKLVETEPGPGEDPPSSRPPR